MLWMRALEALKALWRRLLGRRMLADRLVAPRIAGEPASANGASSMHLWWELPFGEPLIEVSATLEIQEPPDVERLYFWALQVAFARPDGGAAHLGLQYNRRHPGGGAANFGGYAPQGVGGLLDGLESPLPSARNDPNTRDFDWAPNQKYRLSVQRVPEDTPAGVYAWLGSIEELATGRFTVVRVLFSRGQYLRAPVVWTEAFARCEYPSVAVKWSDLEAVGKKKGVMPVTTGSVNYQHRDAGGCDNTNMYVEGDGWVQRTATERTVPTGARLSID